MPRQDVEHFTQVYIYDFTYFGPKDGELPSVEEFIKELRPFAKKWVFQEERTPTTDKLHYQGRLSLFKKKRQPELCEMLNSGPLRGMDVSESSNNSNQFEIFYAMKEETRVNGPWDNRTWTAPPYIPRQYQGLIDTLYPWQKTVLDSRSEFSDRRIDVIVDIKGCSGKSTVASLGRLHYGALDLPPISDHKELLQVVCDQLMAKNERNPGLVFVDCPRSIDQKKMGPYFIAIEQIKKGYVADVRYHYKEWDFDSPRVWVFVNHAIRTDYLSTDRWRFWQINRHFKTLEPYVEPVEPES